MNCITETKIWPNNGTSRVAAAGSVTIADALWIRFRLISKDDGGYFLAFPQNENRNHDPAQPAEGRNKKYFDEVGCINGEVYQEILAHVTAAYEAETGGAAATTTPSGGGTSGGAITTGGNPPF